MTTRRDFLCRTGALAGALAFSTRPARAATALTVGYTAVPDFGAAFIAKERGFFDKRGLDVSLQLIGLTSNVPATLVSNSIQIGGTTPTVFLQAVDSGLDLVGVAAGSTHQGSLNAIGVVVKAGGSVNGPADLVGKKLAVPGLNGTLDVMARRWLKSKGVDPAKVTFVEVQIPQMATVLSAGNVDAVVTAEPFVSRMVGANIGRSLPGFAQSFPDGIATCMFACTREWAAANGANIKAFREGLAEAVEFAKADAAGARLALRQYIKVPMEVMQAIPFPNLQSGIAESQLRFWSEAMHDQGMLKQQPKLASSIVR